MQLKICAIKKKKLNRLHFYLELVKEMINLKPCEGILSAKQFYWEDEFRNNILYRSSHIKFVIY